MDVKTVTSSIGKFAAKFINELDKTKSVVSSPLSAEMVLALLALGSEEPAHTELLTSLGMPDDNAIRASFSLLSTNVKATQGVTLDVANKVYIKEGDYDLNPKLKEDAIKVFDAGLEKIDFDNGAAAANTINKWVESKTNEKIKRVVMPDCFNHDTRLVFVNALYFKGTWHEQFDPKRTSDQPFHVDNTKTVNVPMMYKEDKFMYGESEALGVQLLQLFYEGDEASMVVVLPREVTGLDGVLQKLADGYDLLAELDKMNNTKVQVKLPKFKIETEINLKQLLKKLGIKSIFNSTNSGLNNLLSTYEPLVVSEAVQKAFIEVNEEGTEAAAVTLMKIKKKCGKPPPPPPRFFADRPFYYALVGRDRALLFVGAYRAP